jgi:hypothetical protein
MQLRILALAAAFCAASPAFADTVKLDNFTFAPGLNLNVSSPNYNGAAGQFSGTLNGDSFVTFCTDLSQTFNFGVTYTDYMVVDGVAAWGAAKSLDLDRVFSNFALFGHPANSVESAVIQAITWEILYETAGNPYDFTSGAFTATSGDAGVQAALNGVNWGALLGTPVTLHVDQLYSRSHQDFMVMTQVPEPASYALTLAGLGVLGLVVRRRKPTA